MEGIPSSQLWSTAIAAGSTATGAGTAANWRGWTILIPGETGKARQRPLSRFMTVGTGHPFISLAHRAQQFKSWFALGTNIFVYWHLYFSYVYFSIPQAESQSRTTRFL